MPGSWVWHAGDGLKATLQPLWRRLGRGQTPVLATAWLLGCLLVGGLFAEGLGLDRWLDKRHDNLAAMFAPKPPALATGIVDADDASIKRLGGWPLRRELYAPVGQWLLDNGARAVAFGVLLVDARDGDAAFAAWLANAGPTVLLGARSFHGDGDQPPAQAAPAGCLVQGVAAWQLPLWARGGKSQPLLPISHVGAMSAPLDSDGVLRAMPVWQQAGSLALPSMSVAIWRQLNPGLAAQMRCEPGNGGERQMLLAGQAGQTRQWPLDARHRLRPWLADAEAQPAPLALWRVVEAAAGRLPADQTKALADAVRGRVMLIGSSTLSMGDMVLSAQGWRNPTQWLAASFDALEQHQMLTPPQTLFNRLLLLPVLLPWVLALLLAWRAKGNLPMPAPASRQLAMTPASPNALLVALLLALLLLGLADAGLVAWSGQLSHLAWPLTTLGVMGGSLWWWSRRLAQRERLGLQQARIEAQALARAKSDFLAQVSHELRTPLNALLGAAELLAASRLDATQQRHVAMFSSAGQELTQMLNDLLDLSKSEAGQLQLQPHPFSLSRLVAEQLALFDARANQKGLALETETHPDLPEVVVGDPLRVAQVLRNLLSNAVKFTSVGRITLAIGFGRGHDQLRFEVRDTGIGMSSDNLGRLFAPYTQVHDLMAGRRYGGTGLGLAISSRLVKLMGGDIGVQSREGLGTVFHFELPLPATAASAVLPARGVIIAGGGRAPAGQTGHSDVGAISSRDVGAISNRDAGAISNRDAGAISNRDADAISNRDAASPVSLVSPARPSTQRPPENPRAAGLRVLAADDSALNLMLLRAFLEGGGYWVDTASDGAAALRSFEHGQYMTVLLDLSMPVMDGMAAVQAMRQFEQRRHRAPARIVAVTGRVEPQEVAAALAAGFDAHLAKPYTRDQLLDSVAGRWDLAQGLDPSKVNAGAAANSSWISQMSRLPDSDLPGAVTRLGSPALYERVLLASRAPMSEFENRFAEVLDEVPCDLDAAQRMAHNLKNLAGTVGLTGLAADAKKLEQALADTIAPAHDDHLQRARHRVQQRLSRVCEALHAAEAELVSTAGRRASGD